MEDLEKQAQNATVNVSFSVYNDLLKKVEELKHLKKSIFNDILEKKDNGEAYLLHCRHFSGDHFLKYSNNIIIGGNNAKEIATIILDMENQKEDYFKSCMEMNKELKELKNKKKGIFG